MPLKLGKPTTGSTRRYGSQPLWVAKHGEALRRALAVCCECGKKLAGRRKRWCSQACVSTYKVRSDPSYARHLVHRRDRGVCALCGLDTDKVRAEVRGALRGQGNHGKSPMVFSVLRKYGLQRWVKRHSWWDMDHVVPVSDGGGECTLDNLRTLCVRCHCKVTARWRTSKGAKQPRRLLLRPLDKLVPLPRIRVKRLV